MGIFDNAKSILIGSKEVKSIVIGEGTVYTKEVPTFTVSVNVTDGNNTALEGATVSLTETLTGTTDANGDCTITDVPVGEYTVTAELNGYADYTGSLTVDGDETVNIELSILDTLTIIVQNNNEEAISGATVSLPGADVKTTDENGKVEFTLPYGDYSGSVSTIGHGKAIEIQFRSNHKTFTITINTT